MSEITKSTCRLSWKPPKVDGGARITSYQIERQEVGKPYWVTVSSHCKVSSGGRTVKDDVASKCKVSTWDEDVEDKSDDVT